MNNKDNGGPAFPCEGGRRVARGSEIYKTFPSEGMTLRDYFAIRCPDSEIGVIKVGDINRHLGRENYTPEMADKAMMQIRIKRRYEFADAMLEARNQ